MGLKIIILEANIKMKINKINFYIINEIFSIITKLIVNAIKN